MRISDWSSDVCSSDLDQLPPFIAAGTVRWREIRRAYEQTAAALDATDQSEDRALASDVRAFLDKHQGMNATPEVFAAHHARSIEAGQNRAVSPAPDRSPKDPGRGRGAPQAASGAHTN